MAEVLEPGEIIRRSARVAKWARTRYDLVDDFYMFHSRSATGDFMQSFDEWCQFVEAGEDPLTPMERQYLLGLMTVTEDGHRRVRLRHRDRTARMTMVAEPRRRGAIDYDTEQRIKDGDLKRENGETLGAYLDRLCEGLGYGVPSGETVKAVRRTPLPDPPPAMVQAKAEAVFSPAPPDTRLPYREAEDDMADLVPRSTTTVVKDEPKPASDEVDFI